MPNEMITRDGEVISSAVGFNDPGMDQSVVGAIARAEIDSQITTARAYPRSIQRAKQMILSLATLDEETASECIYALPRGNKPITGPSIRLAEIVQQSWGNNRAGAHVVHVDRVNKFVEAEGFYHDLETNAASKASVRRRIVDSKGKLFTDDMIIVTGNAACSIAKRNAILSGVPKTVWAAAEDAVRRVISGGQETLTVTRDKSLKAFAAFGVKPDQVFEALVVKGLEEITIEHVAVMRGMYAALKNGEATVEEMFAPATPAGGEKNIAPIGMTAKLNALKSDKESPAGVMANAGDAGAKEPVTPSATQQDAEGRAQESGPSAAEPSASTSPSPDLVAARERGAEAFKEGVKRRASPPEYRVDGAEDLLSAWQEGFDDAAEEG